jgi:hypothetical protein
MADESKNEPTRGRPVPPTERELGPQEKLEDHDVMIRVLADKIGVNYEAPNERKLLDEQAKARADAAKANA